MAVIIIPTEPAILNLSYYQINMMEQDEDRLDPESCWCGYMNEQGKIKWYNILLQVNRPPVMVRYI